MRENNLGSVNRTKIQAFLNRYSDGKYSSCGVEFDFDSGRYLVLVPQSVGTVTKRASSMLQRRLATEVGIAADIRLLLGETNEALAAALGKSATSILGENLEDIVVSVTPNGKADVILVVNDIESATSKQNRDLLTTKTESLFESQDLSLNSLCFSTINDDTPSQFQILRQLFTLAPVSPTILASSLSDAGHAIPSLRWLERRLDRLMREKFIQWQEGDEFVVTEKGLSSLPRSVQRNSPDIQRALALAKRKWVK